MARKRKAEEEGADAVAQVTPHARFEPRQIHRRELKNAEYNPRRIKDDARRRLRENLKRVGLLGGIVWNEVTGNIVAGHQRLKALDDLDETGGNYLVPVDVVSLDEKTEREQNVFMNSADAQGEFDLDRLRPMIQTGQIDLDLAGLDASACVTFFGEGVLGGQESGVLEELAEKLREAGAHRERLKANTQKKSLDYYRVVVFPDGEAAAHLNESMNLPGIFLPGDHLLSLLVRP